MLISVQRWRREANGEFLATVLDGRGGADEVRLGPQDAAQVERTWAQNRLDLDFYERLPLHFPAPASIPVEVSDQPELAT